MRTTNLIQRPSQKQLFPRTVVCFFLCAMVMLESGRGHAGEIDSDQLRGVVFSEASTRVDGFLQGLSAVNIIRAKAMAAKLSVASREAKENQAVAARGIAEGQLEITSDFFERWPELIGPQSSRRDDPAPDRKSAEPIEGRSKGVEESVPKIADVTIDGLSAPRVMPTSEVELTPNEREVLVAAGAKAFARSLAGATTEFNLRPAFLLCVMHIESDYEPRAVSRAGAIGLMQLMPETAEDLGANPWDLSDNINGGARLIDELLERYQGDVTLAMAAYNAGPGAVAKHGGVPPYPETRKYVARVAAECPDPRP